MSTPPLRRVAMRLVTTTAASARSATTRTKTCSPVMPCLRTRRGRTPADRWATAGRGGWCVTWDVSWFCQHERVVLRHQGPERRDAHPPFGGPSMPDNMPDTASLRRFRMRSLPSPPGGVFAVRIMNPRYTLGGICMETKCPVCQRPSWAGCGAHVEQVLGHVPPAERCRCRDDEMSIPAVGTLRR